jgi:hypothetical protein
MHNFYRETFILANQNGENFHQYYPKIITMMPSRKKQIQSGG